MKAENEPEYEEIQVPALVIGAGAAGARAAISLSENGVEPLVVGKRDHGDAHTKWAAGGINAALGTHDPEDSWSIHAADTLKEGHFINDPDAVERVTRDSPERIRELRDWGVDFAETEEGIDQRYFGAQSYRRTCFVGDRTGEAILEALVSKAQELEIPYRDNLMVTKLLSDGESVYGAAGYDMEEGEPVVIAAGATVLAAGGYSAVYSRHSSRDDENNGDGVALAYDAGARIMDAEMVQFHPTGMVARPDWDQDWNGRLVTEAVRGEGGRLYNAEGERFMRRYSPDKMELDARDVVARAIASEVEEGRGTENGGVYLDISHRDRDFLEERLPRMTERFDSLGVDLSEEGVEVSPTAHYSMGGVVTDFDTGETTVEGLYAAGETTAGVHGANRLGGNSLAETVVLGKVTGDHVASLSPEPELPSGIRALAERHLSSLVSLAGTEGEQRPSELLGELGETLWETAGVRRDADRLSEGVERVGRIHDKTARLDVGDMTSLSFEYAVDLRFSLMVAEAVLRSARTRTESRGAHYRGDCPEKREGWRKNIVAEQGPAGMELSTGEVDGLSQEVRETVEEGHELSYHHLE